MMMSANDDTLQSPLLTDAFGSPLKNRGGKVLVWKRLPSTPLALQDTRAAVISTRDEPIGVVVVGCNSNGDQQKSTAFLFEWKIRKWWTLPPLKHERSGCAVATVNNTIVVVGGVASEYQSSRGERYNFGSSKSWDPISAMSTPRLYSAAVGLPCYNIVIVVGGRGDCWNELNSVEAYDIVTDCWKPLAPMKTRRFGCAAVSISHNEVLVVGGFDGVEWVRSGEIYDYSTNTWSDIAPMPRAIRFCAATGIVKKGNFVFVTGKGQDKEHHGFVYCYDVTQDRWITYVTATDISGCAMASIGANLLAIGGCNSELESISIARIFNIDHLETAWDGTDRTCSTAGSSPFLEEFRSASVPLAIPALQLPLDDESTVLTDYQPSLELDLESHGTSLESIHPLFATPISLTNRRSASSGAKSKRPSAGSIASSNRRSLSSASSSIKARRVKNEEMTDADGNPVLYSGQISGITGKPNGKGKMQWKKSRDIYQGCFREGSRDGPGRMKYSNGDVFEGTFKNNKKEGHGIYTYAKDGRQYDGKFVDDEAEDPDGTMTWTNGTVYTGQFIQSRRTGRGIATFPNDVTYEGDFKNGKYHGFGVCNFPDGNIYDGQWVEGKAQGRGQLINRKGKILYDGMWENDGPIGKMRGRKKGVKISCNNS